MYFRSLSLLATFACAGLTIIAPLGASDLTNLLGNFASAVSTPTFTGPSPCDVAHPALPEVLKAVVLKVNPSADKSSVLSFFCRGWHPIWGFFV